MSVNTPRRCDVIVLGGGDNGLLCAAYLAKAGAKTLLLERHNTWDYVGGLRTDEFQGPYRFDLLPPYLLTLGERAPCHNGLALHQHGLAYITPPVQIAFHHQDARALVLHHDSQKSAAAIARFNAADAKRFLAMYAEVQRLCEEVLIPSLYARDGRAQVAAQFDSGPLGKRLAELAARTPVEIIDTFGFVSPRVREAMLYLATFWGLDPHEADVGHVAVLWLYCMMNASLARSGNVAAARAMYQCFLQNGGDYPGNVRVERILLSRKESCKESRNDSVKRAIGVRLDDGREIHARAVVSTLNLEETFLELIGANDISNELVEACRTWSWDGPAFLTCHYGYKGEAPAYHAARYDPDTNAAYIHVFGVERAGDVDTLYRTIRSGAIPEGHGRAVCTTQFDEFHAGFGRVYGPLQALRFDVPVPFRLKHPGWNAAATTRRDAALETWRTYASNVVDGPLSYSSIVTPAELQRRLPSFKCGSLLGGACTSGRMGYGDTRPGADYRSEIPGLYMGGAPTHAGGVIHFAAGYNAAGAVADDLNLQATCTTRDI